MVIAIALGVALGRAVYRVNTAALNEFGLATKNLVGEADVVIRGPRDGFDEQLFVELARTPRSPWRAPCSNCKAALTGRRDTLKVLGLDPVPRRLGAARCSWWTSARTCFNCSSRMPFI